MNLPQPNTENKSRILDVLFLIYTLTLITLLLIPAGDSIQLDIYFLGIRTDHFIHASLFLPLLPYFRLKLKTNVSAPVFLKYFIASVLFAVFCECLQLLVPYRQFDPTDIVANVVGVSLGGLAFLWRKAPKEN